MKLETDIKTLRIMKSNVLWGAPPSTRFYSQELGADLNAAPDHSGGMLALQRARWRYCVSVSIDTRAIPACSMAAITFATGP
jgi:hypothetical protein